MVVIDRFHFIVFEELNFLNQVLGRVFVGYGDRVQMDWLVMNQCQNCLQITQDKAPAYADTQPIIKTLKVVP